jgi:hypothetical protein
MNYAFVFLILTTVLTIALVYSWIRRGECAARGAEGFKDRGEHLKTTVRAAEEPLRAMIKKLTHMTKYFADVGNWRERINTAFMTPTELARYYIKQEKQRSGGKSAL